MKEFIIRREKRYCPICEEEHEVLIKKIKQTTNLKNEKITYDSIVYECEECHEIFEDGKLLDENLRILRDAYRTKKQLLTSDEIINIRKKFNLTQEDLSNILGLGEKTIARYETNTIQDKPYDILLRKFNEDYNFAYDMLLKSKEKFSQSKFNKIKDSIIGFIVLETPSLYTEILLKNQYITQTQENTSNGFKLLDIEKIKSMISYFARFTKQLFSVKLMKLFWYSDALSFQRTGKAITGLIYKHMPMGALPIGYKEICELDSVEKIPVEIYDTISFEFIPKNSVDLDESLFTSDELTVLNDVCKKFKEFSGTEISKIMHEENAYKFTEDKSIIDFSIIGKLKAID